jgi:hypothetical protein
MVRGQILIATIAGLGLIASTGCDFIDAFKPGSGQTVVNVFSTHHATPENGIVPDRGGDGEARVFENDEGWTITLTMGYVTTQGATLHRCDGNEMPVDVYFGSLAEDLSRADLERLTIGGTEVGRTDLCGMTVHYGPFDDATDERPHGVDSEDLDGSTLVLAGFARRGEDTVPFDIRSDASLDVHLDLSVAANGDPVRVTGDEDFPVELTLAKTYDRFFDGVDFGAMDSADMPEQALALLELETRVEAE